ncbi:MAG: ArsC family reductase [Lautropia sp.]|nr:ArsC family reductase [Lautropia sp.]
MTTVTVYGIQNCDQIKRTRQWLTDHGIEHHFHDYRRDGLDPDRLEGWVADQGVDFLLNRRGTTWRGFSDAQKRAASDTAAAVALMLTQPALIKRPIIEVTKAGRTTLLVGFSADRLRQTLIP